MITTMTNPTKLELNAVVAVDVILFTLRDAATIADAWQVLLVQRDDAAFAGKWSLPGVLVRPEETFADAARRALQTKAGLDASGWYLEQLGTFGAPDRDTRGRVVSVAHMALERSDELDIIPGGSILQAAWVPVRQLDRETLAFDHAEMLRTAINRTQAKLRYSWIAFQLLPEQFTIPELRTVYAAILDPGLLRLNTGNFKKAFASLFASGALVAVGHRATAGRVGRPGDLYRFQGPLVGTWERELPWSHDHSVGSGN